MDSFYLLLQKIRERPGLYLRRKSLELLAAFHSGYKHKEYVEAWEKWSGRDIFENYDEAMNSGHKVPRTPSDGSMYGFNEFVHSYYNRQLAAMSVYSLISHMSQSEEEAFDKFFELLDEFMKQKDDLA